MPRYVVFSLFLIVSCSAIVISGSLFSWEWVKSQYSKNTQATLENFRDLNLASLQHWLGRQQANVALVADSLTHPSILQNHGNLDRMLALPKEMLGYKDFYIIDLSGKVRFSNVKSSLHQTLTVLNSLEIKRLFHQKTYANFVPDNQKAVSNTSDNTENHYSGAIFVSGATFEYRQSEMPERETLALIFTQDTTTIPGLMSFTNTSQTSLINHEGNVFLQVNKNGNTYSLPAPTVEKEIAAAITDGSSTNISGNIRVNQHSSITSAIWDPQVKLGVLVEIPYLEVFSTLNTLRLNYLISTTFACALLTLIIVYFANARAKLKRANTENVNSKERLGLALEAGNEGIWDWNIQTGEVFYSDKWFTMMGYPIPAEKQTLHALTQIIHPDDKNDVINKLVKNAAWGNSQSQEFRIKDAKGEWHWVQITGKIVEKDSQGNPARIIHTQRDITDNKNYESKLKSLNEKLEQVVSQQSQELSDTKAELEKILICSGDGILGVNLEGRINFCNPIASVITGYSNDELLGKSEHALLHHHTAEGNAFSEASCAILNSIRTGQTLTVDSEVFWNKSGSNFPVEYTSAPILDDKENVKGAVVIFRDISERKAYEIAQREAIIAANEASLAKSNFMANMSHELRTPMNAIIGLADMLRKSSLSDTQHAHVKKIQSSSESLLGIINDILDFSKIESGALHLDNQPFDLLSIVSNVVNLITQKADDKGILFLVDIEDLLPVQVTGDAKRLGQVFTHLLSNAIKFTESGHIRLHIGLDEAQLVFSVSDTGIGIPAQRQQEIFNAFTQADNSSTRQHGGTGLGLAICRQLVNMMGGELSIESDVDKGSKFSFALPMQGEVLKAPNELGDIILISQHHLVRENLRQWLQISGYRCLTRSIDYLLEHFDELKSVKGITFDWTISDTELARLTSVLSAMDIRIPLFSVARQNTPERECETKISSTKRIRFPVCNLLDL